MATQADLARQLLELARADAAAARVLAASTEVADTIVGFHAQQAVEKALKAILAASGVDFPFTHDLAALIDLCEADGAALPDELKEVDRLTPYGVTARYAGVDPGTVDRQLAERLSAAAVEWATEQVDARD